MKTKLKKIWQWFVYSSTDPKKLSMTVQGILAALIPTVIIGAKLLFDIDLDKSELGELVEALAGFVALLATFYSAAKTTFGLVRKIFTTATGENKVVASWKGE